MERKLLPIFFSVNFDCSITYERGDNGEPILGKNVKDLREIVNAFLPEDKHSCIALQNYDGKANATLLNIGAKMGRGEYHPASLAIFSEE